MVQQIELINQLVVQINAAQRAADQGVTVVIASGKGGDCLVQAVAGKIFYIFITLNRFKPIN